MSDSIVYRPARVLPGSQIHITTNPDTEPFWQAAKAHRLTICQCANCGEFRSPPTAYCPACSGKEKKWPELAGTGTIFSYAICNKNPANGEDFVYVPVVVEIDGAGGARLVGNVTGCNAEDIHIGMRVAVEWTDISDDWVLPNFRSV
jgi:uncharacterized OB-fold protein